ncbi:hypothetical protein J6590_035161 [Homalodisca vitripennis]|nr:hypothetical protein J6590_035161 [Homalodisca vitripennis]
MNSRHLRKVPSRLLKTAVRPRPVEPPVPEFRPPTPRMVLETPRFPYGIPEEMLYAIYSPKPPPLCPYVFLSLLWYSADLISPRLSQIFWVHVSLDAMSTHTQCYNPLFKRLILTRVGAGQGSKPVDKLSLVDAADGLARQLWARLAHS